mgnify:CR=1 FL=1
MQSNNTKGEARFWYGGRTQPSSEDLEAVVRAGAMPEPLYTTSGGSRGEYADIMDEVRNALLGLQRNTLAMAAQGLQGRRAQFLGALIACTETAKERVAVLKQLGRFRFPKSQDVAERQGRLKAAITQVEDDEQLAAQAGRLADIWRPTPESPLDGLLQRPCEMGRALLRRLDGDEGLTILNHDLDGIGAEHRKTFIRSGAIAWQKDGVIHLLGGVGEHLRAWRDPARQDGGAGLSPLHVLLLHELTEAALEETTSLSALSAHIVATTFERCLTGLTLPLAAESFFVEWESRSAVVTPPPAAGPEDDEDPGHFWAECIVDQDELRPEAYEQHTISEQQQILREMFGDDWSAEDDADIEGQEQVRAAAT